MLDSSIAESPLLRRIKRILPRGLKVTAKESLRRLSFHRHMNRAIRSPSVLADPSFLAGFRKSWGNEGYSADVEFLAEVLSQIRTLHGGAVLECGSGISTILMSLAMTSGTMWTLESDPDWLQRVARVAQAYRLRNVQLIHAPLQAYGDYTWYAPPVARVPRFQLVICDAPTEATPGGRYGLLPVMAAHLADDAIILLDDAETTTGRGVLARWQDEGWARVELRESAQGAFAIVTPQSPFSASTDRVFARQM